MCSKPKDECYLRTYKNCPTNDALEHEIRSVLAKNDIKRVVYKSWVQNPHASLETKEEYVDEFIKNFSSMGNFFLGHAFLANQNAIFYKQTRTNVKKDECVVVCDFAENYAFVIHNAFPGYHWNYYKKYEKIKHKTLIIFSGIPVIRYFT